MWSRAKKIVIRDSEADHAPLDTPAVQDQTQPFVDDPMEENVNTPEKLAERAWKVENPDDTLKRQRHLLANGSIQQLPWQNPEFQARVLATQSLQADNVPTGNMGEVKGFGTNFPLNPKKGDMFLRVDQLPSVLYKFNGNLWVEVDKALTDTYAYNNAYIDHLINKISSGEYDPELLSDAERDNIERRLNNQPEA
jgi:hypothetical protein